MPADDEVIEQLLARIRGDHLAWVNGDSTGYTLPDEAATIFGGFGGVGVGASTVTPGQRLIVTIFESGTGSVELVNAGVAGDVAWLAFLERAIVRFADHDEPHRWDLRVTEVFERRNGEWVRVHRHADPLVDGHRLDEVLGLLPEASET